MFKWAVIPFSIISHLIFELLIFHNMLNFIFHFTINDLTCMIEVQSVPKIMEDTRTQNHVMVMIKSQSVSKIMEDTRTPYHSKPIYTSKVNQSIDSI